MHLEKETDKSQTFRQGGKSGQICQSTQADVEAHQGEESATAHKQKGVEWHSE